MQQESIYEGDPRSNANTCITCECRPSFEILPVSRYVYVYWACVISRRSNNGLRSKEDLICLTKFSMAAKFIENFIFLGGIEERIDVQNVKVSFIYLNIGITLFVIP